MDPEVEKILRKQGYAIVGKHSAVKLCHWLRESLLHNRPCYKQTFYGIRTHRCLQMSPAVNNCTQNCLFCWRFQGFSEVYMKEVDDPEFIVEESIRQQRRLLTGYKGDPRVDLEKWKEAMEPRHVAISLTGEPTLYPRLGELIEEYHRRGFTTFLVTNGTMPEVLENLDPLPTQLYVTVAAPNEEIYKKLLVPLIRNGWERLRRTLELLPSLNTRKVIRHTLVRGWNIGYEEEYAKLDLLAEPDFIEPKAYVFVGYSRERLTIENMPRHEEIREFAKKMAEITGYRYEDEREDSRVVLLMNENTQRFLSS
ncbi:wyosine biosynthesis protein TYW1 [Aciduliprofundum sp. MAR08-339]|uniref:4-demethylwyosine synthase TYW1 n=1 Tax=Aciduliprofundum sp. (strain MAR08-339) TaxID=673860 RepID=UPI0002A4A3AA|nr:wyosine biosynthesis protein TYW1 [Aciduliprofundum sp. MAR08-339]